MLFFTCRVIAFASRDGEIERTAINAGAQTRGEIHA